MCILLNYVVTRATTVKRDSDKNKPLLRDRDFGKEFGSLGILVPVVLMRLTLKFGLHSLCDVGSWYRWLSLLTVTAGELPE